MRDAGRGMRDAGCEKIRAEYGFTVTCLGGTVISFLLKAGRGIFSS